MTVPAQPESPRPVVIDGTVYINSVRQDGTPSADWIPMFAAEDVT